ncbi:DUF5983 family protein [Hungatella hathewayi]|uniref:DUF5983 family protein n=1 Tax=Hungatella hathewayi TaxID=154046 RepID=UPI0035682BBD
MLVREFVSKLIDSDWKWCILGHAFGNEEVLQENVLKRKIESWSIDAFNHTILISVDDNVYETDTMLTLSTAHINKNIAEILDSNEFNSLKIYPKGEYGWIIYLLDDGVERSNLNSINDGIISEELPEEMKNIVNLAKEKGFSVICFDRDAEIIDILPVFEWTYNY